MSEAPQDRDVGLAKRIDRHRLSVARQRVARPTEQPVQFLEPRITFAGGFAGVKANASRVLVMPRDGAALVPKI